MENTMYPIYVYGSSVLRKEPEHITKDYPNLPQLIDDMYVSMYASDGVGLAAPQIGKSIRLFVIDASAFDEDYPEATDFKKTFINAVIYERFGEDESFEEGCLSVPGIRENVVRKTKIKMRYQDEDFVEYDEEFEGICARVIQHEYDHIDGKLFVDHLSPLRKNLIKSKLAKIAKGDFKSQYPCKLVK